jgi:hypothetical protein
LPLDTQGTNARIKASRTSGGKERSDRPQQTGSEISPPAGRFCQQFDVGNRVEVLLDGQNECLSGTGSPFKFCAIRVSLPPNSVEEMALPYVKAE